MATTSVTLSGFVFDNAGNAVQDAAVVAYTSADNATSAISGLTDTTDANGRWDITTADESQYPMDIKITFGSAVRWIKAANGINLTRLTVSGAAVFGENDTGVDVTMYGATSGRYLLWDESEDALHLNDSTELKIGSLAAGDMILYHDGTNSYITNATGALKIATESSGIAVTIGHGTSEVTVADNLTVTGNLTVSGTQTIVDTVTMNAANAIVFEGATADGYETTLTIEDPTADRTVVIPNVGGTLAVLAADSDTAITATPAEINLIDGGTARGTDAIADGDGVLINDAGTMKMTTVQTLATYMEGEINALSLDVTLSGATTFSNTVTVGVDGTGYDVKFFGDTSSAFMLWDQSEDDLVLSGTAQLSIDTATDATNTTSGSFHTDGGVGIAKKLYVGTDLDVAGTSNIEDTVVLGTLTVGVDDTGHDVKFFGASAGAYLEWDESADQLRIMGASADATTSTGKLLLATSLTDINANDVIGKIDFQAPHEAGGTDAIEIAASIQAIAQGTFSASVNATDLIFYTGHSEAATEKFRFTSQGEIGIGGATYGSSGDVLTSGGAGAAPTWATPTTGDITGVTAGDGLTGGGSSGGVSLALDLVSNGGLEIQSAEVSVAQGISQYDVAQFAASVADNDFLRIDGTAVEGRSASEVLSDIGAGAAAGSGSIVTTGALDSGSITSNFGTINTGSSTITTTGAVATGALTAGGIIKTDDSTNATSTTDGSLQTDGGLSVALDGIFGDDVTLITDSAVLNLGVGSDVSLTHDGTTGGTLSGTPLVVDSLGASALANDTYSGLVLGFIANGTIAIGNAVYVHTADGRVAPARANAVGTMPAIGVAVTGASDGGAIKILVHGIYNDSDGFSGALTEGATMYVDDDTAGLVTATIPDADGEFVQVMGMAVGPRDVYINPSLDIIERD